MEMSMFFLHYGARQCIFSIVRPSGPGNPAKTLKPGRRNDSRSDPPRRTEMQKAVKKHNKYLHDASLYAIILCGNKYNFRIVEFERSK